MDTIDKNLKKEKDTYTRSSDRKGRTTAAPAAAAATAHNKTMVLFKVHRAWSFDHALALSLSLIN